MSSVYLAVRNQALAFPICLFPQATAPTEYLDSPTLASGDFTRVGYDSAGAITLAKASLTSTPTVSPASSGNVVMLASATEMDNDIVVISWKDVAGLEWCSGKIIFLTVAHGIDTIVSGGTGTNQISLSSGLVTLANGSLSAAKFATDAIDANALKADAIAEIQSGLATPTNITAGTITTVTNLTNAPTVGDLTAAMKASVTTAATAATPTAASVTAPVTVGTNNDKTNYALSSAGVQAIFDKATSALTTVGSFGKLIVDYLDAAISSRMAMFSYTTPPTAVQNRQEMDSNSTQLAKLGTPANASVSADIAAVKSDTGSIVTGVAALPNASTIATTILDTAITEPTSVFSWSSATVRKILQWLAVLNRNKMTVTSTTQVVRNDADNATIATSTVSDDNTTGVNGAWQ